MCRNMIHGQEILKVTTLIDKIKHLKQHFIIQHVRGNEQKCDNLHIIKCLKTRVWESLFENPRKDTRIASEHPNEINTNMLGTFWKSAEKKLACWCVLEVSRKQRTSHWYPITRTRLQSIDFLEHVNILYNTHLLVCWLSHCFVPP